MNQRMFRKQFEAYLDLISIEYQIIFSSLGGRVRQVYQDIPGGDAAVGVGVTGVLIYSDRWYSPSQDVPGGDAATGVSVTGVLIY